jgi:hypothetical protein
MPEDIRRKKKRAKDVQERMKSVEKVMKKQNLASAKRAASQPVANRVSTAHAHFL